MAGMCVSFVLLAFLVACGGGGSSPPPPPISVTVSPSTTVNLYANEAGNAWPANLTQQQFTAVVNNSTNQSVTWAVTGGAANGSIDSNGLYTAPALVPNPRQLRLRQQRRRIRVIGNWQAEHPGADCSGHLHQYFCDGHRGCSGIRLMIFELRRYNKIGELLIGNRTPGLQAQVNYQDMVREASVTRAAVYMGVKEMGM